eukprot:gene44834-54833_t
MCDSSSSASNNQYALCSGDCGIATLEQGEVRKVTVVDSCSDGAPCVKISSLYADSPVPVPGTAEESTALDQARKLSAEFLGTAMLVTIIVGSGIMAQRLSPNDVGLQLLENAVSIAGGLV